MLVLQISNQAKRGESSEKRKGAFATVRGWLSKLRGGALSFTKKLLS